MDGESFGSSAARLGRWAAVAAPVCAMVLVAGCTSNDAAEPAPSPSPAGSVGAAVAVDDVREVLPNDLEAETYFAWDHDTWEKARAEATSMPWHVVSGGGVEQAAACVGEGQPTVVYINGWASPAAAAWPLAAVEQAKSNRVCMFDRPGNGLSPARHGAAPHSTPEQHAEEMLATLDTLGEAGPYVLVPWSYGGLVARAAATQHPDRVAGMVLVDATSPLASGLDQPLQGENGIVDTDAIAKTVGSGPAMGARPVVVLEAGVVGPEAPKGFAEEWHDLQQQAATISDNSVHAVVDDSDHAIPMRNPQALVAATTAVVESVRAGNADLPACPDGLAAAGVTCTGG